MNVLITGGGGFLGSAMVKKLIHNNHKVLVFSKNIKNIEDYVDKCKIISSYVDKICEHEKEISEFQPDIVLHFGWSGGNNNCDINKTTQFFDNVPYSIKFLELLNTLSKKPKFIGVGSFAEYGEDPTTYFENHIEKPKNFYGLCKKMFCEYSKLFCEQNYMDWVWIRPCFIYGPNDVETRLIPKVINKMIKSENIQLDDCQVLIDYLYIEDFSDFVYKLIMSKNTGVYNVCSGEKYHLKELIIKIKNLINSESEIIFDKSINKKERRSIICGSNLKLKLATNKEKFVDLEEGLKLTIEHIKKLNKK
jgi:nucleoside-diphosphate-sugar epimerase